MDCYVYIWYDRYRPFYVGIGGETRLKSRKRNKKATRRRERAESSGTFRQEIILKACRDTCADVERLIILTYGSVAEGGLLFNFTKGGDGGDTFSFQPPERKEEIKRKVRESRDLEACKQGGELGGPIAAQINKERGNGPWDPEWRQRGTEAILKSREENPEFWLEISRKGAKNSWEGKSGEAHRLINASACAKTGKITKVAGQ